MKISDALHQRISCRSFLSKKILTEELTWKVHESKNFQQGTHVLTILNNRRCFQGENLYYKQNQSLKIFLQIYKVQTYYKKGERFYIFAV